MTNDNRRAIAIRSGELSAEIDSFGAQLSVLRDAQGCDLQWNGDPAVWNGRAPLLFPIVGSLAGGHYRLEGRQYSLSRHGFARGKPFELIESNESSAAFRLRADEQTLAVYPFRFELDARFEVAGPALHITVSIRNPGNAAMPASFGFHPALRWPLPYGQPREKHFIEFEVEEPAPIRRLDPSGLLAPEPQATPVSGRRLTLVDALFEKDVIFFDRLRSHHVIYGAEQGPRIRVSFPDTSYLGVWTKPGAQFICIEPWHGFSDPAGFDGDFTAKPGVFRVPAGGSTSIQMTIALEGQ
jgi:galactose mutarotase-like enzyme